MFNNLVFDWLNRNDFEGNKMKKLPKGIKCFKSVSSDYNRNGPNVVLLKQTHGNELGGKAVVDAVLEDLVSIDKGNLYHGVGNPKAAAKNKRFVDNDLNRSG